VRRGCASVIVPLRGLTKLFRGRYVYPFLCLSCYCFLLDQLHVGRLEGSHGWKEGTGNGQGQRIIDSTPDSAKEDAAADVMGAHSSSCSGRY